MSNSVIDASDPMYVNPSDTPGLNLINEQLLGTENYGVWIRAMLIALRAKNKIAFIDGSCKRPTAESNKLLQWEQCNALVLAWIMNVVSKEILSGIVYSTEAEKVWSDLRERFDKVNGSRIFMIHREIGRLEQSNNTIATYYSRLRQLWNEYDSLVALPSCACDSAKKYLEHDQQHKLLQFLMGLNESYAHIRSHILLMDLLPSASQAYALISQEESHRNLVSIGTRIPEAAAFYSTQEKKRSSTQCEYCNWPGHSKENCYKLVGYPAWHKLSKGQGKTGSHRMSQESHDKGKKPGKSVAYVAKSSGPEADNATNVTGNVFTVR